MPDSVGGWWKNLNIWSKIFLGIVHLSTLAALVFASIQWRDSRQIVEGLSTKYLGPFPESFPMLAGFVSNDESHLRTLDIVADYAAFGDYSAPEAFRTYLHELETSPDSVHINLLINSNREQERLASIQFTEQFFESETRSAINKEDHSRMISYFRNHANLIGPCTSDGGDLYSRLDRKSFLRMLLHEETDAQERLRKRANTEIRFSDEQMPFFLWIRNRKEAIFAIRRPAPEKGFAAFFQTSDSNLIQAYGKIFDALWDENSSKYKKEDGQKVIRPVDLGSLCQK